MPKLETSRAVFLDRDGVINRALVRDGKNFTVQDAKSGEDLTRTVLAQIIFEQENRKEGVLPVSFLRQLIQQYGENVQSMLPAYLELSMKSFTAQQEKWREYVHTALGVSDWWLLVAVVLLAVLVVRPMMAPVRVATRLRRDLAYRAWLDSREDAP